MRSIVHPSAKCYLCPSQIVLPVVLAKPVNLSSLNPATSEMVLKVQMPVTASDASQALVMLHKSICTP